MDLEFFKNELIFRTAKDFSWDDHSDEDRAIISTRFWVNDLKVTADLDVCLYGDGTLFVTFTFGRINDNLDAFILLNKYNNMSYLFKGKFARKGRDVLLVVGTVTEPVASIENALDVVMNAMNLMNNEKNIRYLEPLVEISY